MANLVTLLRYAIVLSVFGILSAPASAQQLRDSRSLYIGSILNVTVVDTASSSAPGTEQARGNEPVILDLSLFADGFAYGRLLLPARGLVVVGSGSLQQGTELRLVFNESGAEFGAWGPKLAHDASLGSDRRQVTTADQSAANVVASFSGRRDLEFGSEGRSITGALAISSEPGTVLNTDLRRFAEYSTWAFDQGRIHASVITPHLFAGGEELNVLLEDGARQRLERFVTEGRRYVADGVLGWAWELEEYVTIEGVAGSFVSLLNSTYSYTGGAHPNTFYTSGLYELRPSGVSEVRLAGLFRSDSNWLARLTPLILADLEDQGAAWVTQGQVTELSAADLATFTLGPRGLSFHFAPYAMGPYVQGPFVVTVEYGRLLGLAPAGGALEFFARGAAFN